MPNGRIRVLVVEDDEDSYVLTRELLDEVPGSSYVVDWAPSFEQAVTALESGHYDICLADYHLGNHNGAELIARQNHRGDETPVVVFSGSSGVIDLPSIRAGAGDFLPKLWLTAGALHRSLQYTLERHGLLQRLRSQQRELEASETRLRTVVENVLDSLIVVGLDGGILFVNPEASRAWGPKLESLVAAYLTHPATVRTIEIELPEAGNQYRIAEVRSRPIEWQMQPARVLSIRDITERLALEEQLHQAQKMEAVGRLTGGIAHDLNNILTIILANAALLQECTTPEGEEDLALVQQAAARGADLIRRLMTFSRRQNIVLESVRPRDVAAEFLQFARRLLPESVELEVRCDEHTGPTLADPGAVMQILLNLATNARDAMPEGGRLVLEIEEAAVGQSEAMRTGGKPGLYLRLTVTDTGCGMDEATRQRVLEPFFTTKEVGAGSGLGLPMVYGLVSQHHGFIEITSRVGHGSSVRVFLPRARGETPDGDARWATSPPEVGLPEPGGTA